MEERGKAIVLIGPMGVGKSATGRALARQTGWERHDTDEIVVSRFGMSIREFFAQLGEEKFREVESETLRGFSGAEPSIIVTGGGIVLRPENRKLLRALGMVVNLEADEAILLSRISRRKTRPLLLTADPATTLAEMMRTRRPFYNETADFSVNTSNLSQDEVAAEIRSRLKNT